MNAILYTLARFYQVRATRARTTAIRLEAKAEKIFRSLGIGTKSRR